jgi:hypothetical protein
MPIYVGTHAEPSSAAVRRARQSRTLDDPFRRANIAPELAIPINVKSSADVDDPSSIRGR